ncbi:hypothetical protein PoB_005679200 [Plakobranchus ocellatus]|uniref:Uncharacterized protein n=1 Tax=Plakobranchus ocellatus TaxID=259542 RepID=A0AAV4CG70_9GAST|nr:hypothetical protein PoB_005679200 [Plakobranchus ocellatus]
MLHLAFPEVKFGIHPSMDGDGFIRLPKERLNVKCFTLKLVFRPEESSGLLLFASKYRSDFFSITLEQDRVFISTAASESALRSAGTLLSRVRAPPPAPWPDGGPESLRSPCCGLAL